MKYKVGDKVRVRRDLVVDKRYGGINCLQVHKKECGKIFTIEAIEGCNCQLNNNLYWWSEKMLEEVDEMKYKVGDKVKVRKDLKAGSYYGSDIFTEKMKNMLVKL